MIAWMHAVLMRPRVKALFEQHRGRGIGWLETLVVIWLALFAFAWIPHQAQTSPAPARVTAPTNETLSFGPTSERILPHDASLALASGRVVDSLPTEVARRFPIHSGGFHANQAAALEYMRQEGLDLFYSKESGLYADMKVTPIVGGNWDELNADQSEETIQRLEPGTPQGAHLEGQGFFGFKTRGGGSGILQITGFTDNPRGVKIRYKLVREWKADVPLAPPSAPAAERPDGTLGPAYGQEQEFRQQLANHVPAKD